MDDTDNPYGREDEDEERRYCEELQRRILAWETDPKNFLRLQKRILGLKTIAPISQR